MANDRVKNDLQELLQKCHLEVPEYKKVQKSGLDNSPFFTYSVSVKLEGDEELTEVGQGKKKKEAEKDAASKMLQRLRERGFGGGSRPSASMANRGELQALLKQRGLAPAVYSELPARGPSHKPVFTMKLEIFSLDHKQLFWTGQEDASTKKEAEALVTDKAFTYLQTVVQDGKLFSTKVLRDVPPLRADIVYEGDEVSAQLSQFRPTYVVDEVDGRYLVIALAAGADLAQHPVAAHGQGESHQAALQDANLNLLHNITSLYSSDS